MVVNLVLLQCIGIPMGIDPARFWENLHLYNYEIDFISSLIKTDLEPSSLRMPLAPLTMNAI